MPPSYMVIGLLVIWLAFLTARQWLHSRRLKDLEDQPSRMMRYVPQEQARQKPYHYPKDLPR